MDLTTMSCPSLRKEFGRADGKAQEKVGGPMAKDFLLDLGLSREQIERAAKSSAGKELIRQILCR